MFSVKSKKPANKFLKSLKVKEDLKRILNKIRSLKENPFPNDSKRIEGYKDFKVFRVRVGFYHILYYVDYENSVIYVEKIDKRERVY